MHSWGRGVVTGRNGQRPRFFHTLGVVGLFQDCEQGGGRLPGPAEDALSSAAEWCLSPPAAAPSSLPGQGPGTRLCHPCAAPARFILLVLPLGGFPRAWSKQPPSSRIPANPLDLPGGFQPPRRDPRVCDTHHPQDRLGQPWKKPTMECEVENGW